MTEQDVNEQKLVQETLGNLPRPTPPPRLRRAVMAQVRREAATFQAQAQAQIWRRTEAEGWAVEWQQCDPAPVPASPPDPVSPPRATFTQWRHQQGTCVTVYQTTRTH